MFTGIVQGVATIVAVTKTPDIVRLEVEFPDRALDALQQGASISLDGCCLTVTKFSQTKAAFDLVPETLARTTFGVREIGARVNFERSLKFGDEVGGHILSGHVDVVASICALRTIEQSRVVTFKVEKVWTKYLFVKGYVAISGASLTITGVDKDSGEFTVSLIPETLAKTTLGEARVGDRVNVEIDRSTQAIVDTVERVMEAQRGGCCS